MNLIAVLYKKNILSGRILTLVLADRMFFAVAVFASIRKKQRAKIKGFGALLIIAFCLCSQVIMGFGFFACIIKLHLKTDAFILACMMAADALLSLHQMNAL